MNSLKRVGCIESWKSKKSDENLSEKYVEEVTGHHIVEVWKNGQIPEEILKYFYFNIENLFYDEKSKFYNLFLPYDFINQCLKSDKPTMDHVVEHIFEHLTLSYEDKK